MFLPTAITNDLKNPLFVTASQIPETIAIRYAKQGTVPYSIISSAILQNQEKRPSKRRVCQKKQLVEY